MTEYPIANASTALTTNACDDGMRCQLTYSFTLAKPSDLEQMLVETNLILCLNSHPSRFAQRCDIAIPSVLLKANAATKA